MIITHILQLIRSWRADERGQGLVEYALIIALISIVAALALAAMAPGGFDPIADAISGALSGAADALGGGS